MQGACVVSLWHGDLLPMIALHRGMGLVPMASLSRDGDRIAKALEILGYEVIRGSTSKGAMAAYRQSRKVVKTGGRPVLTVDGPRGPRGTVHPGAESLARAAGVVIVHGEVEAHGFRLRSWDRFLIPWPFAAVKLRYTVWHPDAGAFAPVIPPI